MIFTTPVVYSAPLKVIYTAHKLRFFALSIVNRKLLNPLPITHYPLPILGIRFSWKTPEIPITHYPLHLLR